RGAPPARLYIAVAGAAIDLGDDEALAASVELAEALVKERNWPVIAASRDVVRAYEGARASIDGARGLVAAAEALEAIGAISDAVFVKRDAAKWLATH